MNEQPANDIDSAVPSSLAQIVGHPTRPQGGYVAVSFSFNSPSQRPIAESDLRKPTSKIGGGDFLRTLGFSITLLTIYWSLKLIACVHRNRLPVKAAKHIENRWIDWKCKLVLKPDDNSKRVGFVWVLYGKGFETGDARDRGKFRPKPILVAERFVWNIGRSFNGRK